MGVEQPMDSNKLFAVYTKWQEKCQSFVINAKEFITEATMINKDLMHGVS